jgi:FixJ family two-component response regulator
MNNKSESTVFIIDADPAARQSLKQLLEKAHLSVETYPTAKAFFSNYDSRQPGCLITGIHENDLNNLELQKQLQKLQKLMPVIIITEHGDVPTAVSAIRSGAIDFIIKPFDAQLFVKKVKQILAKDVNRQKKKQRIAALYKLLTEREKEIMQEVVAGKLNKQIANELNISIKTVELHRSHLMQKMDVDSLAELVKVSLVLNNKSKRRRGRVFRRR